MKLRTRKYTFTAQKFSYSCSMRFSTTVSQPDEFFLVKIYGPSKLLENIPAVGVIMKHNSHEAKAGNRPNMHF